MDDFDRAMQQMNIGLHNPLAPPNSNPPTWPTTVGHIVSIGANETLAGRSMLRANFAENGQAVLIQFGKAVSVNPVDGFGPLAPLVTVPESVNYALIQWGTGSSSFSALVDVRNGSTVRVLASYVEVFLYAEAINTPYTVACQCGPAWGAVSDRPATWTARGDPTATLAAAATQAYTIPPYATDYTIDFDAGAAGGNMLAVATLRTPKAGTLQQYVQTGMQFLPVSLPNGATRIVLTNPNVGAITVPSITFRLSL